MARLFILKTTLAVVVLTAAGAAMAQGAPKDEGPPREGPPKEALAACTGKAADAACSFVGRRGEKLNGKCFMPPARPEAQAGNKPPMACRPDGMRPGGGPPQQQK